MIPPELTFERAQNISCNIRRKNWQKKNSGVKLHANYTRITAEATQTWNSAQHRVQKIVGAPTCFSCIESVDPVADLFGLVWFVSSTGQTCPEGRSTNRTQVLCGVLHPTLSRKTRKIDHNTGNYVPYSFR